MVYDETSDARGLTHLNTEFILISNQPNVHSNEQK